MARQLFGTDGIRGVAGEYPLDIRTVFAFGRAVGEWAGQGTVLVGMDTRESGPMLATVVRAGLAKAGVESEFAGVLPTPGVAWLTKTGPYKAGVMISASHNPYQDNGLKVFAHSGYKVPDEEELGLERRILELATGGAGGGGGGRPSGAGSRYREHLQESAGVELGGMKIVVDGGNGAASAYAPALLRALGAEVVELHCAPDGRNINAGCGAVHPEAMQEAVVAHGAALGVAFDGDADRAIFASHTGRRVDGDHVLYLCGRDLQGQGRLTGETVVATSMSNLGLELALRRHGIGMVRTAVGDKYVLEEMVRRGAVLGGEQSGHVIFHDTGTTGDGMMTMLRVLGAMRRRGARLEDVAVEMPVMPQRLVNVRFGRKRPLEELDGVQAAIRACEAEFGEAGRVVVRFSGTEPLARVMVEGAEAERVDFHVQAIADAIAAALRE